MSEPLHSIYLEVVGGVALTNKINIYKAYYSSKNQSCEYAQLLKGHVLTDHFCMVSSVSIQGGVALTDLAVYIQTNKAIFLACLKP